MFVVFKNLLPQQLVSSHSQAANISLHTHMYILCSPTLNNCMCIEKILKSTPQTVATYA